MPTAMAFVLSGAELSHTPPLPPGLEPRDRELQLLKFFICQAGASRDIMVRNFSWRGKAVER